jgi:hypothetical protein
MVRITPGETGPATNDAAFTAVRITGVGAVVTTSVTFTVCGLFVAPLLEISTEPVYVPAASAVGVTLTEAEPGVVPLAGETCSQPEPLVIFARALQLSVPPVPVIWIVCAAGADEFVVW